MCFIKILNWVCIRVDVVSVNYEEINLGYMFMDVMSVIYEDINWVYMCMDVMTMIYEEMNLGIYT